MVSLKKGRQNGGHIPTKWLLRRFCFIPTLFPSKNNLIFEQLCIWQSKALGKWLCPVSQPFESMRHFFRRLLFQYVRVWKYLAAVQNPCQWQGAKVFLGKMRCYVIFILGLVPVWTLLSLLNAELFILLAFGLKAPPPNSWNFSTSPLHFCLIFIRKGKIEAKLASPWQHWDSPDKWGLNFVTKIYY